MPENKKMNIAIRGDLLPWVEYAAALNSTSVTAYINDAIERDMEGAEEAVKENYRGFLKARPNKACEE